MTGELPVLVAGGGPVGVTAALLLARHGVPSVVLEAAPERAGGGSKALCMQRDVLDVLNRLGVAAAMVAEGVTWSLGRTYYRDHELFETRFPDRGRSAWPPFVNISQTRTEELLGERVDAEPLVEVRRGWSVTDVAQDADGVTVTAGTRAGPRTVRGSHLVAADGARSAVRTLLGLGFPGHSFDDQFLIADVRARLPFAEERRFYFDPEWNPGRQVLVHPQAGSVWRIDWQVPGDFDLAAERSGGGLDRRVRRIVGDTPYEVVWASAYRFHQRLAPRFALGRVLLAGDAAHLMSPFGARGLNSGLQDAENLAWKLAYVRRGWAGEDLLDSYETERRAAAEENLRVTDATMRFLVPRTPEERERRRAVLERCVTDPAAVPLVDSGRLAEPFWYLDSPLTTGKPPADFPREAGAERPPVPGVLCPDGPCRVPGRPGVTRLRELFGAGMVLLAGPQAHAAAATAAAAAGPGPVDVVGLAEIDVEGVLARALEAGPSTAHVVRPDGHLAAVLHAPLAAEVTDALDRATGRARAAVAR